MDEAGVGFNSPEFLQKKIERLKTALDEANLLMDRQVTERDEARAQLAELQRENSELKRQLDAGGGAGAAPDEPALDPKLEQHLREKIETLQAERDSLKESLSAGSSGGDEELHARIASLQTELATAQSEAEAARGDAATARGEAATARSEA